MLFYSLFIIVYFFPAKYRSLTNTIQARSDLNFSVKSPTVYFYTIKHNFQLDQWIKLKFLQEFLDMLLYIRIKVQINLILGRDNFIVSKLLDESCQIYLSGPSSTFWTISKLQKEFCLDSIWLESRHPYASGDIW
jgi:hypothetical protein